MGNALSDPYNMKNKAEYAYQLGLIDIHGYREMKAYEYMGLEKYPHPDSRGVNFILCLN